MNTLQAYDTIIDHVTKTNNLAARLRRDEITKTQALDEFKDLLTKAQEKLS